MISPDLGEEEAEELKGKLEESDPILPRLRALNEDAGEGAGSWNMKIVGDE